MPSTQLLSRSDCEEAPRTTSPAVAASSVGPAPGPKFARDHVGFQAELRRRVAAYFAETGKSEQDCWQMYLKTALIAAWTAAAYVLLVFYAEAWWQAVPLALCLAGGMAVVGFSIQHDGGHRAYSRREWVNQLMAFSLDLIGASSYLWRWKHGVLHHTHPNVVGRDTDIEPGAVARFSPHQPRYWFHRWQHLYLWPLYAVTAPRWHLYTDFQEVVKGHIAEHRVPRPKRWDLVFFLLGKVFSIGFLLGLPMFFHPVWVVALYYLLAAGSVGVMLTVVFQLAHCVGEADFPAPEPDNVRMADAWAVHQIRTTVDFGRNSRLLCWLLGGLNFQIEHHLFPRVCHIHYPALSRIVEKVCHEYGVRFSTHTTFAAGIRSHYRWLRHMGRAG